MASQDVGKESIDIAFLTELKTEIQQLQDIMVAVATGGPRIQDKEADYTALYRRIDSKLRFLQSHGLDMVNPNSFKSLWDWYKHWSSKLPQYQPRRDYVWHLYDNVLTPVEIALDQITNANGTDIDLPQLLRLGVYQQTAESLSFIPTEIRDSFRRFQVDHPDPLRTAFIMMRFGSSRVHNEITSAIRSTLLPFGINGLRADDKQYHDDLFSNVLTYMHGCGFGIAVFERIETNEFNPNVSLEVGYMLALRKSVCLLKDKTLTGLQVDLVGKLYSSFDTYDIINTMNSELSKWLLGKGFVS